MIKASQHFDFRAAAVLLASIAVCVAPGDDAPKHTGWYRYHTGITQDNI